MAEQLAVDKERKKAEKADEAEAAAARQLFLDACAAKVDELTPLLNRVVEYYEDGWRAGYLLSVHTTNCDIQPTGVYKGGRPQITSVRVTDVRISTVGSKYETLDDYIKFMNWTKPNIKATLITPKRATPVASPAGVVATIMDSVVAGHRHDVPVPATPVNGKLATAEEIGLNTEAWDANKAVAMYQGGMKVSDIAAHFGDKNKQNRVRKACRDAGVYKDSK